MTDKYVSQFDHCGYLVDGKSASGFDCTMAVEAMFLYRATQGRVDLTACELRRESGDTSGGTNLDEAHALSVRHGVTGGVVYRPTKLATLKPLLLTSAYPTHAQGGYSALIGTPNDQFGGRFPGAHDIYVKGANAQGIRYGDPGGAGWQSMSWGLFERFLGALPLGEHGPTLEQDFGTGYAYAYVGPRDPIPAISDWHVTIDAPRPAPAVQLYTKPFGAPVLAVPGDSGRVRDSAYACKRTKVNGYWWFQIEDAGTNHGRFLTPSRYVSAVPA